MVRRPHRLCLASGGKINRECCFEGSGSLPDVANLGLQENIFIDYWQSSRISILGPREPEALVLTDGQSDVAGTVRTGGIYLCDSQFGWKIWILSFQAERPQTLKLDGCTLWERKWGSFFYFQTVERHPWKREA